MFFRKKSTLITITSSLLILLCFACEKDLDKDPGILKPEDTEAVDGSKKPESPTKPSTNNSSDQVLAFVNEARIAAGLNKLVLNSALNKAALKHSQDMQKNNYLEHVGKDGSKFGERAKREGYKGFAYGENIANGYNSAQDVHNGWMKSSGHRSNILQKGITEMGIGRAGNYWTQIFGKTK